MVFIKYWVFFVNLLCSTYIVSWLLCFCVIMGLFLPKQHQASSCRIIIHAHWFNTRNTAKCYDYSAILNDVIWSVNEIRNRQINLTENIRNFVLISAPADVLAHEVLGHMQVQRWSIWGHVCVCVCVCVRVLCVYAGAALKGLMDLLHTSDSSWRRRSWSTLIQVIESVRQTLLEVDFIWIKIDSKNHIPMHFLWWCL